MVLDQLDQSEKYPRDVQTALVAIAVEKAYGFRLRKGQASVLWSLMFNERDVLLSARTSFGKSLLFQAPSIFRRRTTTIIIIPITKVGQEQSEKLENYGAKPCLITAETLRQSPRIWDDVRRRKYTHILMSPEIATSARFGEVLKDTAFRSSIRWLAIDEAHLVRTWGEDFRKQYAQLSYLRSLLPSNCVWSACSATLDDATVNFIRRSCRFSSNLKVWRTTIDRPEISLVVQQIRKNKRSTYEDLFFTVEKAAVDGNVANIPKTVIYLDSVNEISVLAERLREWIRTSTDGYQIRVNADSAVETYYSNLNEFDKQRIYEEFRKEDSQIRIIVATESLGLGVDLDDIEVVVQYGLPRDISLAEIWQRFGRVTGCMVCDT